SIDDFYHRMQDAADRPGPWEFIIEEQKNLINEFMVTCNGLKNSSWCPQALSKGIDAAIKYAKDLGLPMVRCDRIDDIRSNYEDLIRPDSRGDIYIYKNESDWNSLFM